MTFWLDAQLDPELAAWLGATFKVIAKTVREIGLRDATDEELFAAGGRFKASSSCRRMPTLPSWLEGMGRRHRYCGCASRTCPR
jgi:hypothetical protein